MEFRTKSKINLDPRTKILLILLGNILMFSYGDAIYLHIGTAFAISLMVICGKVKSAVKFTVFCLVIYGITYLLNFAPKQIASLWSLMILSIVIFMPLYALAFLLFTTTSISEIITALQKMKVPAVIITPLIVMFRFFPTIKQELHAIRNAMKLKGVRKNPMKLMDYVYVPLLFNCVKIGEDLNISGVTRGLGLYKSSTQTASIRFTIWDFIAVAVMLVLICLRRGILL